MLDLKKQPELPRYELVLKNGEQKSYDALIMAFEFRVLEGVEDPTTVQQSVNKILAIDVDAFTAMQILNDFVKFTEEHLEEQLKKVPWLKLSSATSTDSPLESTES